MVTHLWIDLRKENWSRLEGLLAQAEAGGLKRLSSADLRDLGLLYRQAASPPPARSKTT